MKSSSIFFVATLLASLFLGCNNTATNSNTEGPLFEKIKSDSTKGFKDWSDFPIGGAVDINTVINDSKLSSITTKNFNSITATNDMKMYCIIPQEGPYNWGRVDTLVNFCEQNDQRLFGHALVWHYGAPYWIQEKGKTEGSEWVKAFLEDYITKVVTRYKGKVDAWDVVNEGFESHGGAYRKSFWYNMIGENYIANAYHTAHKADPDAKLFYNDFNIERDTAKLDGVIAMVEEFKANDVPIHGIGFQMHIRMETPEDAIEYALKKVAKTGLLVHISELDIIFNKHDDTEGGGIQVYKSLTDSMQTAQSEKYKRIAEIYRRSVPKAQQYGITFWDYSDRDTWIKPFFKLDDWPTVFDQNLDPKPAYYGFAEGLISE